MRKTNSSTQKTENKKSDLRWAQYGFVLSIQTQKPFSNCISNFINCIFKLSPWQNKVLHDLGDGEPNQKCWKFQKGHCQRY